jgi:3-isopropylmalate/(R)-2-methylmalate dehydratase small subunit
VALMDKFTVLESLVVPLDRANIDTDQIIPQKYLQSIKRTGFGDACFASWRRDPEFVLNQPRYKGAQILLARKNFGIGSSREHAPWALRDYGFRAVIAPSFGEIFQNNSLKNGFLPVALAESEVDKLFYEAASFPGFKLRVDLGEQSVSTADGSKSFRFDIDPFRKHCLLNGLDDIGLTMEKKSDIEDFETRQKESQPWLHAAS